MLLPRNDGCFHPEPDFAPLIPEPKPESPYMTIGRLEDKLLALTRLVSRLADLLPASPAKAAILADLAQLNK